LLAVMRKRVTSAMKVRKDLLKEDPFRAAVFAGAIALIEALADRRGNEEDIELLPDTAAEGFESAEAPAVIDQLRKPSSPYDVPPTYGSSQPASSQARRPTRGTRKRWGLTFLLVTPWSVGGLSWVTPRRVKLWADPQPDHQVRAVVRWSFLCGADIGTADHSHPRLTCGYAVT
jgi:hypothetical protein